ncbi:MAG TPA: hypothetical protein VFH72_00965 [Candidatus Baltobacteraceae bacterium]|nr:hypothetical protein [Candidatus Baltobacteraceae bacterium]
MLRFVARAFCLFAVLLPLSAAAQLPVPPHVNLHNGYIEIIDRVQVPAGFKFSGIVKLNGRHEGEVRPGGTFVLNRCCILAGSHYEVEVSYSSATARMRTFVTPRLCNIRGIPFGYAVIEVAATFVKTREGSGLGSAYESYHVQAKRVDTSCPVEK